MSAHSGPHTLRFFVTGFGRFRGVDHNPTTVVVSKLGAQLSAPSELDAEVECKVLETSTVAVDEALEAAYGRDDGDHTTVVAVHFGVHAGSSSIKLERLGFNDANFSVPDERGYQPQRQPIAHARPYAHALRTTLPMDALLARMKADLPGEPIEFSDDAGRFVCNYTYFSSLHRASQRPRSHALFVHVPLFTVVSEERQLAVAAALLRQLRSMFDTSSGSFAGTAPTLEAPVSGLPQVTVATVGGGAPGTGGAGTADAEEEEEEEEEEEDAAAIAQAIAMSLQQQQQQSAAAGPDAESKEGAGESGDGGGDGGGGGWWPSGQQALSGLQALLQSFASAAAPVRRKMVLVVRDDLRLGKGKIAAQCCHATLGLYRHVQRTQPARLAGWEGGGEAKVVVRAKDLQQLQELASAASAVGLPTYMVQDAGRTQVAPGTATVLAIGPAPEAEVDAITGGLRLL